MGKGLIGAVVVALFLAASWPAKAQPALTLNEFRERVAAEIARAHPGAKVERVEDDGLTVQLPGASDPSHLYLARLHSVYVANPGELDEIVRKAAGLGSAGKGVIATPETLVVIVRPLTYDFASETGDPADRAMMRPLAGDLAAFVAIDSPESYAVTRAAQLRGDLGLEDSAIWARAIENTRPRIAFERQAVPVGSVLEISTGEGMAASLPIDDGFWDSTELTARGPVIVAVIDRDVLMVGLLSDGELVKAMKRGMKELEGDPNALTDSLLVRKRGRWEVLR